MYFVHFSSSLSELVILRAVRFLTLLDSGTDSRGKGQLSRCSIPCTLGPLFKVLCLQNTGRLCIRLKRGGQFCCQRLADRFPLPPSVWWGLSKNRSRGWEKPCLRPLRRQPPLGVARRQQLLLQGCPQGHWAPRLKSFLSIAVCKPVRGDPGTGSSSNATLSSLIPGVPGSLTPRLGLAEWSSQTPGLWPASACAPVRFRQKTLPAPPLPLEAPASERLET